MRQGSSRFLEYQAPSWLTLSVRQAILDFYEKRADPGCLRARLLDMRLALAVQAVDLLCLPSEFLRGEEAVGESSNHP